MYKKINSIKPPTILVSRLPSSFPLSPPLARLTLLPAPIFHCNFNKMQTFCPGY